MFSNRTLWGGRDDIAKSLSISRVAEIEDLRTRLDQFQFCINLVAEALGNVCCGGVDSSPEDQLADPHSTTRVLCDAIAKLKRNEKDRQSTVNAVVLLQEWADQIKDCHTVPETGDWGNEIEAKENYDEIISCIEALR